MYTFLWRALYIISYIILQNVALFINTVVRAYSFVSFVNYSVLNHFSVSSMILLTVWWKSAYCHSSDVFGLIYAIRYCSLTNLTTFLICWKDCRSTIGLSFAIRNNRIFLRWNDTCWMSCRYSSFSMHILCVLTWPVR